MEDERVVTMEPLEHALRTLGLAEQQVVMLHTSVKAVGWVVGGSGLLPRVLPDVLTP